MKAGVKIKEEKIPKSKIWATLGEGMLYGAFEAVKGAAVGRVVSKVLSKSKKIETFSKTRRGSWALEISQDLAIDASLEYLPKGVEYVSEFVKNSMKKKK